MWPDDFVQYKDLVAEDQICFVQGIVEKRTDEPILQLTKLSTIEQGSATGRRASCWSWT